MGCDYAIECQQTASLHRSLIFLLYAVKHSVSSFEDEELDILVLENYLDKIGQHQRLLFYKAKFSKAK
jgi:hypothetical protein